MCNNRWWDVFCCEDVARRLIGLSLQLSRLKNWPLFQFHSLIIFFPCVYSSSWSMQVETCLEHRAMLQHAHSGKQMTSGAFYKQPTASQNNSHRETANCMTLSFIFLTKVISEWQNKLLKQTAVRLVCCVLSQKMQ